MPARAPLDVDLEDKLLYGLTPMRLGYMVLALLGAFALWSSTWAATPVRAAACVVLLLGGATVAWGRWRGRPLDGWLTDIAAFIGRTKRVIWNEIWVEHFKRPWPSSRSGLGAGQSNQGEAEVSPEATQLVFPDAAIVAN